MLQVFRSVVGWQNISVTLPLVQLGTTECTVRALANADHVSSAAVPALAGPIKSGTHIKY